MSGSVPGDVGAPEVEQRRGEGGYVLLIVLVAVGVFALVLMALLTRVGTDSKASAAYSDANSARRAVDGGLQYGLAQIKATPTATLRSTLNPCSGIPANPAPLQIEGRAVTVDCVPSASSPVAIPTTGDNTPVLTLLRNYDIAATDPTGQAIRTFFSFFDPTFTLDNYPGFVHVADDPLPIVGNVKVRQAGIGMIPKSAGPAAVTVQGTYQQGDPSGSCGGWNGDILDPQRQFQISATVSRSCGTGSPSDRDNVSSLVPTNVPVPAPTTTAVTDAALDDAAAQCAGPVVKIPKGSYTPAQVGRLNTWLGPGNCDGVTFWFAPGAYTFDAAAPITRASLVFNDPTSNIVFGTPRGWADGAAASAVAATFPEACDPVAPGVAITLGATTSIDHKDGRVAMCGSGWSTTDNAMISQRPAVTLPDEAWAGEPDVALPHDPLTTNADFVTRTVSVPTAEPPGYPALGRRYDVREGAAEADRKMSSVSCLTACAPGWILSGWATDPSQASTRQISTAVLKLRGSAATSRSTPFSIFNNPLGGNSRTVVTLQLASGQTCQSFDYMYPTSLENVVTIDLLNPTAGGVSTCRGVIKTAKDLETATITVFLAVNGDCYYFGCQPAVTINLDYLWLETHTGDGLSPDPLPFNVNIDTSNAMSFTSFGRIFVPRIQIDVKWRGSAATPPATELPLFIGDVTARGLASSTLEGPVRRHVGMLAARSLVPASRHVTLRAIAGGSLLGTAEVQILDTNGISSVLAPATTFDVVRWDYCNVAVSPTATC